MWFGTNISLLCWFQLSLRNRGLHNVWIQLAWNYGFREPSFLAPVTSPCVYVCGELARAEWKNHLSPVQIPPNDRHTTQTGSHYPADDIKTTAYSSASMRQHGNELWERVRTIKNDPWPQDEAGRVTSFLVLAEIWTRYSGGADSVCLLSLYPQRLDH